jgi:hypothetical protein
MGWLAAWFLGLDSLLYRLRGPVLLTLLAVTVGGLLAAVVALGWRSVGARSRRGGHGRGTSVWACTNRSVNPWEPGATSKAIRYLPATPGGSASVSAPTSPS